MPGPSGDEDGNAGAFTAPACRRHRGHSGRGKPTPNTVLPMQHDVTPTGPKWQAPCHSPVLQGRGTEEAAACGIGDEGAIVAGL